MANARQASDSPDFASLAARVTGLNGEQASQLVELAAAAKLPVWQYALEQGQLNAVDVDIIKTLLSPRESIPGYEILDLIGRGGMGVVYRARQLSLNREVALKTIQLSQLANTTAAARFENEAQLLARLTHPHIVAAFDFGRHAGRLFLAMELVEGKDVERLIAQHGRLPERLVWHVIRQAAAGLAHAARVDVIHRDIKPANLLLVHPPDGFALPSGIPMVKIADFGLSILADDQQAGHERLTSASVHVGSPTYMAPEQLESGEIQHSADIFALGATAWHMLAGKAPLQGSGLRQLIMQRLTQPTDAIDRHTSQVSPATVELLHDMLRIDARQRIAQYSLLLQRIDHILVSTELAPAPVDPQLGFDTHDFLAGTASQAAVPAATDPTRQWSSAAQTSASRYPSNLDPQTGATTYAMTSDSLTVPSNSELSPTRFSQRMNTSWRLWLPLALVLGLCVVGVVLYQQPPAVLERLESTTGPRQSLFDGSSLAGWSIQQGSWFPGIDAEGAAVLQGSDGTIGQSLAEPEIETFPGSFVLEATCQLATATGAQLALIYSLPDQSSAAIVIAIQPDVVTVSSQASSTTSQLIATHLLAATLPASSQGVLPRNSLRLERQTDRWWVLLNGQVIAGFASAPLQALQKLELSSKAGMAQFSDLSIASLELR